MRQHDAHTDADSREAIRLMAEAYLSCGEHFVIGGFSPDARDFLHAMTRAVGIGTLHGDHDPDLLEFVWELGCDGQTPVEIASAVFDRVIA
jgi:hypothetical protein